MPAMWRRIRVTRCSFLAQKRPRISVKQCVGSCYQSIAPCVLVNEGEDVSQQIRRQHEERMRHILILAGLAGIIVMAGPAVASAAANFEAETGLVVMVDDDGTISSAGQVPIGFRVKELRKRIPELNLSAGVIDDGSGDPDEWRFCAGKLPRVTLILRHMAGIRALSACVFSMGVSQFID